MRDVTVTWRDYIQLTTEKTLTKCLRVETRAGVVYGTTTHTRDFLFEGVTYYTSAGLLDTAIARTEGFTVDNMEFTMVLTEAMHTAIEAGKFDGARCYFFMVDYTDVSKGEIPLSMGYVGEITRDAGVVKAEILGLMSRLGRKTGRVYSVECDAVLGDDRCKVPMLDRVFTVDVVADTALDSLTRTVGSFSLERFVPGASVQIAGSAVGNNGIYGVDLSGDFVLLLIQPLTANETATYTLTLLTNRTFTKSVSAADVLSPRRMFTMNNNLDSFGAVLADQWLFAGVVTFLTGANAGEARDVSSHIGADIECYLDFPFAIEAGDTLTISVGCDLLRDTCRDKFGNINNNRGFHFAPTNEDIFYSPAQIG